MYSRNISLLWLAMLTSSEPDTLRLPVYEINNRKFYVSVSNKDGVCTKESNISFSGLEIGQPMATLGII